LHLVDHDDGPVSERDVVERVERIHGGPDPPQGLEVAHRLLLDRCGHLAELPAVDLRRIGDQRNLGDEHGSLLLPSPSTDPWPVPPSPPSTRSSDLDRRAPGSSLLRIRWPPATTSRICRVRAFGHSPLEP